MLFISFKSIATSITYPNTILVGDTSEKAVKKVANKTANRASLYSAILPGMGQAYNKKYWKMPIVYAALGAFGYFIATNSRNVHQYHTELSIRYQHGDSLSTGGYVQYGGYDKLKNYSTSDINTLRLDAKKYLDFFIIGAGLVYILNIIDANVDGHFKTFDVSDKLSLSIKPKTFYCIQNPRAINAGLSLTLNFKK